MGQEECPKNPKSGPNSTNGLLTFYINHMSLKNLFPEL